MGGGKKMNYGYNERSANWKEERKEALAKALAEGLPAKIGWTPGGVSPYIEVDGAYGGVRIRKVTHLADDDLDKFRARADKIYEDVMALD